MTDLRVLGRLRGETSGGSFFVNGLKRIAFDMYFNNWDRRGGGAGAGEGAGAGTLKQSLEVELMIGSWY